MTMKQRDAVFQAVINVCGKQDGVAYNPTDEQRAQVSAILFEGFRSGTIAISKEFDDAKLKAYCSGLQSNWLRKDSRLNGNTKYTPKNPGSRTGSADAQVTALRVLMANKSDPVEKAEIQVFIDRRLAEIKPAHAKKEVTAEQAELLASLGLDHLL